MKINLIVIVGFLCAILAVAIFALVATQQPFPVFKFSAQSDRYINITQNVGPEDSRFMWNSDNISLIAQAFALFAAAAATLALLRHDEKREPE